MPIWDWQKLVFCKRGIDQALIGAQTALQLYTDQHNAHGTAHAYYVLGEVNIRRGQLSYANALMERALRTYQATAFRLGQAETNVGLGMLQYLHGFLERARQTLEAGRQLAHTLHNTAVESRALLTIGDVLRQQGQLGVARNTYSDALAQLEGLDEAAGAAYRTQAEVSLARIAIFNGDFKAAETHQANALAATQHNPLASYMPPLTDLLQGLILLAQGDFPQAEHYFSTTMQQAEAKQDPSLMAEAILGQAQAQLARGDLEHALNTFLAAGRQFQFIESTDGDGLAVLGVAQVYSGQEHWDEALENCAAALLRFQQSGDLLNEADTLLTRGLAQRSKDELAEALADFEQALKLYHQQHRPLGVADTRFARGSVFLLHGDLERAYDEQTKALALVERVMNTLRTPQQWSIFLRQYAEQYAETAITAIRRQQNEQARTLLQSFVRIAGSIELKQHIAVYSQTIPTSGDDLSEAELLTNRNVVKQLEQLRGGL